MSVFRRAVAVLVLLLLAALLLEVRPAFGRTPEQAAARAVASVVDDTGMVFLDREPKNCQRGADGVIWLYIHGKDGYSRGCWKRIEGQVFIRWDDGDIGIVSAALFKWLKDA